ncbi:MAG: hypothetical protein Q9160_008284 [Pyrenula sp. 1 TL-2023]
MAAPSKRIKQIDNRPVPTATGRADGLQPRTLEILRNLGLKRKIMAYDPARVYEVAFWDPVAEGKGIHRTGTWASCPSFLDSRYPFTALLHQGLIERVCIEDIEKNGTRIERPCTITGFTNDGADETYPVQVSLKNLDSNVTENVRTKYLFSGEGAKSLVRDQLGIGIQHKDPISHVWGVMDGVVRTNFPDIKMKCTIHSDSGSIMVIPREANMVRLYIQIASSTDPDFNPRKSATAEEVQQAAKRILRPYIIEWDRIEWYSVYPIGQGIAEKYTLDHRVFLGGDCCHTHSPKAGQGMNTAFHDAINIAWKLHHVERGFASPSILSTYESERRLIAETLLNFDAAYASLFSKRQPSASEVSSAHETTHSSSPSAPKNEFVEMFKSNCEFTSGYGVAYQPNIFNLTPSSPSSHPFTTSSPLFSPPSCTLVPGRILPRATTTRVTDANTTHLEQAIPFNGSFRLFIYAGQPHLTRTSIADLCKGLSQPGSFYRAFPHHRPLALHSDDEQHNPHTDLFSLCVVYAAPRNEIEISALPELLQAYREHIYADDLPDIKFPGEQWAAHRKEGKDSQLSDRIPPPWPNNFSILKTTQEDVVLHKIFRDRIRHEEAAYRQLRPLWGKYIPQLIGRIAISPFHKSWPKDNLPRYEGLLLELIPGDTMEDLAETSPFENTEKSIERWVYLMAEAVKVSTLMAASGVRNTDFSGSNIIVRPPNGSSDLPPVAIIDLTRCDIFPSLGRNARCSDAEATESDGTSVLLESGAEIALISQLGLRLEAMGATAINARKLDGIQTGRQAHVPDEELHKKWHTMQYRLWTATVIHGSMVQDIDVKFDVSREMYQRVLECIGNNELSAVLCELNEMFEDFDAYVDTLIVPAAALLGMNDDRLLSDSDSRVSGANEQRSSKVAKAKRRLWDWLRSSVAKRPP